MGVQIVMSVHQANAAGSAMAHAKPPSEDLKKQAANL